MPVDARRARNAAISRKIGAHYVDKARELPWRSPPGALPPEPYLVWLSEIMLQQTTVAAVKPYFEKFVARWSTVAQLAAADQEDVLAAWAGLGYYSRARNLHKCARQIVDSNGGVFPYKESELLALPGIGPYTAAAIAAIAFGERAIVVDANIERLVARLFAIDEPLPRGKTKIRAAMESITPKKGAGDFAQACMDIGAIICTAKAPKCEICPVSTECLAHEQGKEGHYPVKPPKKSKPVRRGRFFWVERHDELMLVKRPERGMLGGMRALPDDRWSARADGDAKPPLPGDWHVHENIVQHGFTHFSLEVDLAVYRGCKIVTDGIDTIWWPLDRIGDAGLPTLFAKAVRWKMKDSK